MCAEKLRDRRVIRRGALLLVEKALIVGPGRIGFLSERDG